MMKKMTCYVLIFTYLFLMTGCSGQMRRKFIRKKKEEKTSPVFTPEDYSAEFTLRQRYINHYTFWKNAETEIINILGQEVINNKKLKFHTNYALVEIKELHNILPDYKQWQIETYVNELTELAEKLYNSSYVRSHKHTLVTKLKRHYKEVSRNFSYSKVKEHLPE